MNLGNVVYRFELAAEMIGLPNPSKWSALDLKKFQNLNQVQGKKMAYITVDSTGQQLVDAVNAKADVTYIDAQLSDKADITYIDTKSNDDAVSMAIALG